MNALDSIIEKGSLSPLEYAIYRLWLTSQNNNNKGDGNQKTIHDAVNAAAELADLQARLSAAEDRELELKQLLGWAQEWVQQEGLWNEISIALQPTSDSTGAEVEA